MGINIVLPNSLFLFHLKFFKTPFAALTPIFICGILLGGIYHSEYGIAFIIVFLTSVVFALFKIQSKSLLLAGIIISMVLLGAEWMDSYRSYGDSFAAKNTTVIVEIEEAEVIDRPWKKTIGRITHVKTKKGFEKCSEKVLFFAQSQLVEGDVLFLKTDFKAIENANNPGEFNAKQYWNNKNIYKMAFIGEMDFKFIDHNEISASRLFFKELRLSLTHSLDLSLDEEEAGIAKALLLGDKSTLSIETKRSFSNAGAMHVLAVSGLHVGIIMYLLLFIIGKFSRFISKRNAVVVCVLLVWIYAGITGFSPSVMRAAFMFSVLMIGQERSRNASSLNTLFFSAFVLLVINPMLIYDIGFQLSYLAVLGILLTYQNISRLVVVKNKWLRKIWEGTAVGISAQIFTVPLSLYQFHQFPNYFMLSNIGIMAFAGILLSVGIVFFMFKGIVFLQSVIVVVLGLGITMMLFFIQFIESIPGAVATGFVPTIWTVILLYVLILSFLFLRQYVKIRYAGILTLMVVLVSLQMDRNSRMEATEMVFFNSNVPIVSIKTGNTTTCFHGGKEGDLKKVKFLMESYSKVKPASVKYVKLADGKTKLKSKDGIIEITSTGGNIYVEAKKKTYFLRTRYGDAERVVDQVIDLPYLAESKTNYNLKKGAYCVDI